MVGVGQVGHFGLVGRVKGKDRRLEVEKLYFSPVGEELRFEQMFKGIQEGEMDAPGKRDPVHEWERD